MEKINTIIEMLDKTPFMLQNLLSNIHADKYTLVRVPGKWSIHEQVCHLVDAQEILLDRFKLFENNENPLIKNHEPSSDDKEKYAQMDMNESLEKFPLIRRSMTAILKDYPSSYWDKKGRHENFEPYGTQILLMHCLNVDYAHMFSIEQLGLTKVGKEKGILTLP